MGKTNLLQAYFLLLVVDINAQVYNNYYIVIIIIVVKNTRENETSFGVPKV